MAVRAIGLKTMRPLTGMAPFDRWVSHGAVSIDAMNRRRLRHIIGREKEAACSVRRHVTGVGLQGNCSEFRQPTIRRVNAKARQVARSALGHIHETPVGGDCHGTRFAGQGDIAARRQQSGRRIHHIARNPILTGNGDVNIIIHWLVSLTDRPNFDAHTTGMTSPRDPARRG